MTAPRTPGVYYQTVDAGTPSVTPFRTDITGFVGLSQRGPIDVPVPVQSWRQFESWFGEFIGGGYLAYAVRAFFENGGQRCWVVRVASADTIIGAAPSGVVLASAAGPVWRVRASSAGTWGDALAFTVRERNPGQAITTETEADGRYSVVANTTGFERGTHVRVSQAGAATAWKVVASVDPHLGRLYWTHPDQSGRLPSDGPLTGFDLAAPVVVRSVEYALVVHEAGRLVRFYDGLSLTPQHERYGPLRLAPPRPIVDAATGAFVAPPPEPIVIEELRTDLTDMRGLDVDPARVLGATGGRDGLASLSVADFIGQPVAPGDGPDAVAAKRRGLRALEDITEVALLAVPDAQVRAVEVNPVSVREPCVPDPCVDSLPPPPVRRPPGAAEQPPMFGLDDLFRIQSEMVLQCELKRDRVALLDPPLATADSRLEGIRGVVEWRARFDSTYAAIYYPWVRVVDPLAGGARSRLVPPAGHVAGAIAGTDLADGVHRAPANRRIDWSVDASVAISDAEHGILNGAGVNVLRASAGRGLRVQGARTVASDPAWRFLNVRRLMIMVERALEAALEWVVFEPNEALTRIRVTMSVTIFLLGLHEAGMLAGATPEESFFVKCDLGNNPAATRNRGQVIVEIGLAPAKPFEFVVLRVGRVRDALEISEA